MFGTYLELGIKHILDLNAYDHLLFIVALIAPYTIRNWKKLIILATAFTIGHTITLILSTLEVVSFPTKWIEFFIPCTILVTALYNLYFSSSHLKNRFVYWIAAFFGLIHGMGFSNFLRASVMPGEEDSLIIQLLAFNIGIELAQIIIIFILIILIYLLHLVIGINHRPISRVFSGIAIIFSMYLMIQTWPL